MSAVILVLSSASDATTDLLVPMLSGRGVFRFNIDLWRDYRWRIDADGYQLLDPTGRVCRQEMVGAVYLRKLIPDPAYIDVPAGGSQESWVRDEVREVWEGIRDMAQQDGRLALVHPAPTGRWNKMRQMRVAARHFPVPPWWVLHPVRPDGLPEFAVAKSFGHPPVGGGALMLVNRVPVARLDPAFPWFLQECLDAASHDVTVVYVNGRLFAYEASRAPLSGVDCRRPDTAADLVWEKADLSVAEGAAARAFMAETGFSFGRLDFLRAGGRLWFLELNPNGQFAWLDEDDADGLLSAVVAEIFAVHDRHLAPM